MLCESGEDETERDKTLVEPEFPGLWSQECDLHKVNVMISLIRNRKEKKMDEILLCLTHCEVSLYQILTVSIKVF